MILRREKQIPRSSRWVLLEHEKLYQHGTGVRCHGINITVLHELPQQVCRTCLRPFINCDVGIRLQIQLQKSEDNSVNIARNFDPKNAHLIAEGPLVNSQPKTGRHIVKNLIAVIAGGKL